MRVKGSALRARVQWVERQGQERMRDFLAALTPETRNVVERGVVVSDWYSFEAFVELNTTIDRLFGRGDLALCLELGRFACEVNLTTIYRLFFKLGSVRFIIGRCAAAWRVNYDAGELQVAGVRDDWVCLRVLGVPKPHRAHCLAVSGWIQRACELSGGTLVPGSLRERCRLLGDLECEFEFSWTTGPQRAGDGS